MQLVIALGGKRTVIGEVYEDRLPSCTLDTCDKRISFERVYRAISLGHEAPLYCSRKCGNVAANRAHYHRSATETPAQARRRREKRVEAAQRRADLAQRRATLEEARVRLAEGSLSEPEARKLQRWIDREAAALAKLAR
jgi:hypothetical protein